jgi:N-acetylmuramoyl-L-alanine amidase
LLPTRFRLIIAGALLLAGVVSWARQPAPSRSLQPFSVVSPEGRRPLPATASGADTMVALDDLAALFQLTVREDALAGGVTVGYKGKSVILTPGQALASAAGRIVSLPCPPARDGRRWLVPVEFVGQALAVIYDSRLEVRKNARLVIVGAARVPRIVVREEAVGPQTRVTLSVTPRTPYTIAHEAGRVVVRFDADAIDLTPTPAAREGLVQSIKATETGAAVSIEAGPRLGSSKSTFVPQEDGGQVVIDLLPAQALPPLPAEIPPATAGPAAGPFRVVVVDPGHGGSDTGARGTGGAIEKDITLAAARRLRDVLESRLGVRVLLTRDADAEVTPDQRAALANNNMADLFISLHANASLRREAAGVQVYSLSSDLAAEEMRRTEAATASLPTLGGGSRTIELVPWDLAQLRHLDRSAALAESIVERLRGRIRLNARAVGQAPMRVLAGVNTAAVVVEMGFLTNPEEEQQLAADTYQSALARALLDGVLLYRDRIGQAAGDAATPAGAVRRRP